MTWVRIDDRMPHHAKLRDAGEAAGWLWICGLCWCNAQVNDGHIRAADLACLYPGRWNAKELAALAQRLVDLELWHVEPGGFLVHGYAEEQREAMRDRVEARKEKDRNRKGGQNGSARNPSGTPPDSGNIPPPPGPGPGPGPGSEISDSSAAAVPDQVARDPAPPPFEPAAVAGTDFARLAEVAWTRAVAARGGSFAPDPSADTPRLRSVAVIVDAQRGSRRLDEALAASATAHLAQRRSGRGTPRSWLEWAQSEASAGTTRNGVSPREDFDPSPVPGRNLDA